MEIKLDLVMIVIVLIGAAWALMRWFVFKPLSDIDKHLKEMSLKMQEIFANLDKRVSILEYELLERDRK